jgi:hypothetical protein
MSEGDQGTLACGFGDVASGLAGLAWELGQPAAALLERGEVHAGSFGLEEGGDAATVAITAGDAVVEAVLAPGIDPVLLEPVAGAGVSLTVTPCAAEVRRQGGAQTVECTGQITRWIRDPLEGATTFRHLTLEGADGALLIATAWAQPGAEGHGDERTSAWRIDADGQESHYGEALISTQYDGDGHPTRIGLELWPGEDSPPTRVACSVLGGADAGGLWAGLMRCHVDGSEALGSYLLSRA